MSTRGASMTKMGPCRFPFFATSPPGRLNRSMSPTRDCPLSSASRVAAPRAIGRRRAIAALACVLVCAFATSPALAVDRLILDAKRDEARREVEQARDKVNEARAEAVAARARLDAFLARHFTDQPFEPPPAATKPKAEPPAQPNPQRARLESQLEDLRARRHELLGYLTEEHPEVVDVSGRIATIEEQIALFDAASLDDESSPDAAEHAEMAERWNEYVDRQQSLRSQDAVEYQRLYDEWQAAERRLDRALAIESAAADRLAAIESALAEHAQSERKDSPSPRQRLTAQTHDAIAAEPPAPKQAEPNDDAQAVSATASDAQSGGSQPLALAALLIALAVAALAAVKLARSTADPIFASADEVAAALAIPVVGIIPAAAARLSQTQAAARRRVPISVQLLVALGIFALVAYLVQNPTAPWQLCKDALQALITAIRAIGGK